MTNIATTNTESSSTTTTATTMAIENDSDSTSSANSNRNNRSDSGTPTKRVKRKSVEVCAHVKQRRSSHSNKEETTTALKADAELSLVWSSFVQDKPCWVLMKEAVVSSGVASTTNLTECRECSCVSREEKREKQEQANNNNNVAVESNIVNVTSDPIECRFVGWRRLRRADGENQSFCHIEVVGFLSPDDANERDISLWSLENVSTSFDPETSGVVGEKILRQVGPNFESIIEYETKMRNEYMKSNEIIWKRLIEHTREMCDQCRTTLFNGHFACLTCGFAVCPSCFELRKSNNEEETKTDPLTNWCYCVSHLRKSGKRGKKEHEPDELTYVQYILPKVFDSVYSAYKKKIAEQNSSNETTKTVNSGDGDDDDDVSSYLCLNASESSEEELTRAFESRWAERRPVLIRNVHTRLNTHIWSPQSFADDFGELRVDLINCRNNRVLTNMRLGDFWSGFENPDERLCDKKARPMILKLKDWPNSDDFKHMLPDRYADLMDNMPIKEYVRRNAHLNLVSHLPDSFCLPDLGPKLYVAYSSANTPKEGTTNLHVDISDAVNLLIYAPEIKKEAKIKEMIGLLEKTGCSSDQIERFKNGETPGALWHIFRPQDADEIRSFLVKEELLKGRALKKGSDPIHDQVNYIDAQMVKRLASEHNVRGFTVLQFLGDAIFIPSGAPHQVRNVNSCIKVALDFVSSQGVDQCLVITDQLRHLSEKHSNREDKLQVKNIIYHAVKKFLSSSSSEESK